MYVWYSLKKKKIKRKEDYNEDFVALNYEIADMRMRAFNIIIFFISLSTALQCTNLNIGSRIKMLECN